MGLAVEQLRHLGGELRRRPGMARVAGALGEVRRRLGTSIAAELAEAHAELEEAHAELARRQKFMDALLETVDIGIVSCDANGDFFLSNRAERELFGLDTTLDGQPMWFLEGRIDVFDRDGRRLAADEYPLTRTLRGEDLSDVEVLAGPAGGPYRELQVRGRRIIGPGGEVLGAVAALTDMTAERAAARKLADQHRQLVEAQRLGRLGSFECNLASGDWSFSDNLAVLWGLDPAEVSFERMASLITPEDLEASRECWRRAVHDGGSHGLDVVVRRASDGSERVIRATVEVDLDDDGRPVRCRGTHLDITELHSAEKAAGHANTFLGAILAASPDLTFVADMTTGEVIYTSPSKGIVDISSRQPAAGAVEALIESVNPVDRHLLEDAFTDVGRMQEGQVVQVRCRCAAGDGQERWLNYRLTPFERTGSGQVTQVLAVVRDVTDVVAAEQRLVHAASHDPLTGLPNRLRLMERLESALDVAATVGHEVAVLFCDLDGFKAVNDTGGHAAGDAVLTEVGRRLVKVVRDADIVARVGGDEFLVVIEPWNRSVTAGHPEPAGDTAASLAVAVAERVREELGRPVTVGGEEFTVTASIGIALAGPGDGSDGSAPLTADVLLHRADTAMYRAKERGKDRFSLH